MSAEPFATLGALLFWSDGATLGGTVRSRQRMIRHCGTPATLSVFATKNSTVPFVTY